MSVSHQLSTEQAQAERRAKAERREEAVHLAAVLHYISSANRVLQDVRLTAMVYPEVSKALHDQRIPYNCPEQTDDYHDGVDRLFYRLSTVIDQIRDEDRAAGTGEAQ